MRLKHNDIHMKGERTNVMESVHTSEGAHTQWTEQKKIKYATLQSTEALSFNERRGLGEVRCRRQHSIGYDYTQNHNP